MAHLADAERIAMSVTELSKAGVVSLAASDLTFPAGQHFAGSVVCKGV